MRRIDILLATYNGAEFLTRQLHSIATQTTPDWTLIVRDDGSVDGTWDILREFAGNHSPRVHVMPDNRHVGLCAGISQLMAASRAEYIMFCDQDDVWMPKKIEETLACMKQLEAEKGRATPLLVHCDLTVADRDLAPVCDSFWSYQGIEPENAGRFNRQLVMNAVTGCAMMINRPLLEMAAPIPPEALVHDWWIALVAAAFGHVDAVRAPLSFYRQHEANRIGAKGYTSIQFLKKIGDYFSSGQERDRWHRLSQGRRDQILAFHERFAFLLNPMQKSLIADYERLYTTQPLLRFFIMARSGFWRTGLLRNIAMGMAPRFLG